MTALGIVSSVALTGIVGGLGWLLYRNRRWPTPEKAPPHITGIDPYGRD